MPAPISRYSVTPSNPNFGNVTQSTSSPPIFVVITNTGSIIDNLFLTPIDPRFVCTPSGNVSIAVGASLTVSVVFNATLTLDTVTTQWIGVQGGTYGTVSDLTATTVPAGSLAWNVTPNPFDFGSLKIGDTSSPETFTITNNDPSLSLTINTIADGLGVSEFIVGGISLPVTLTPGQSTTFTVTCIPEFRGNVSYSNALVLTPAVGGPINLGLSYEGFELTPAYILTGATQGVLVGLAGAWDMEGINYTAQSLSSLPCEAAASLVRQNDFGNPSSLTNFNRLFMRVDPLGALTTTVTDTCIVSNLATTTTDTKTRSTTNDALGISDTLIFDLQQNGEIHQITISVLPNGGILSLIYLFPAYEARGSLYELA